MENPRWWHVAVCVLAALLTVMVLAAGIPAWQQLGALAALAVFVAGWFAIGRLSWRSPAAAVAFSAILIVAVGAAVGFLPIMAIMQCLAYPLLWVIASSRAVAVAANVALAAAVAVGFWFGTGDLVQTALTAGLSLGFSLALGLWIARIAELSEQRQELLTRLQDAQAELAAAHRDSGVTSERERLAREIHDTIAQDLTGLVLLAQRARRELAAGRSAAAEEQLALIEESARQSLAETRALVAASAPVGLANGGIADALDRLGERFSRETSVAVTVETDGVPPLDRDSEVVLLRVAQESLANVRKHANAASATVRVASGRGAVSLIVSDDGAGFDPAEPSSGFGIAGMRERLALVGGTLEVSSSPAGTVLTATLPIGASA